VPGNYIALLVDKIDEILKELLPLIEEKYNHLFLYIFEFKKTKRGNKWFWTKLISKF